MSPAVEDNPARRAGLAARIGDAPNFLGLLSPEETRQFDVVMSVDGEDRDTGRRRRFTMETLAVLIGAYGFARARYTLEALTDGTLGGAGRK